MISVQGTVGGRKAERQAKLSTGKPWRVLGMYSVITNTQTLSKHVAPPIPAALGPGVLPPPAMAVLVRTSLILSFLGYVAPASTGQLTAREVSGPFPVVTYQNLLPQRTLGCVDPSCPRAAAQPRASRLITGSTS